MLKGIAVRRFWLSLLENTWHSIKHPTMSLRKKKSHTVFMFVLLITSCFLYQLIISPILYSVFQRWLNLKGPFMPWVWYHGNIITRTDLNLNLPVCQVHTGLLGSANGAVLVNTGDDRISLTLHCLWWSLFWRNHPSPDQIYLGFP